MDYLEAGRQPATASGVLVETRTSLNGAGPRAATLPIDWSTLARSEHIVHFYEAEEALAQQVSDFIGAAMRAGDIGIVLATPPHREAIVTRLEADSFDTSTLLSAGQLVSLDAAETLETVMTDGAPDHACFDRVIGGLLEQASAGGGRLCIFGEMVALLCAQGRETVALELEALWNSLADAYDFVLLCSYPMSSFAGDQFSELFGHVCGEHGRVIPTESYSSLASAADQMRAIAELQQKAHSLQAEVEERKRVAEENVRLYQQAQKAIRVRDDFLVAASHDLRTPLTVVQGYTQMVRRRLAGRLEPDDQIFAGLESIERKTRSMARVLDELMDATRLPERDSMPLDRAMVDLGSMVRDVAEAFQFMAPRHTIEVHVTHESIVGDWDSVRLTRVLGSLLSNAIKYSPQGGAVRVRAGRDDGRWATLEVEDEGLGIPPADIERIFERFYRAENVLEKTSGTGIGLTTARQIVEQHGGTIAVQSEANRGSRFTVRLPLRRG